ncbi:MAG: hypothetical protein EOM54_06570 [Clostridia bacterium]|nr:hypothetical protein [Clostridia bacterium]
MKNTYLLKGTYLLVLSAVLMFLMSMGAFGNSDIVVLLYYPVTLIMIVGIIYGAMGFFGKDAPEEDKAKSDE